MNITSPRQLISILPTVCGEISDDSVIIIVLDNGQVQSSLQISDWEAKSGSAQVEQNLKDLTDRTSGTLVAVACIQDEHAARRALETIQTIADVQAFHILDLLHIFSGCWRSILCQDDACCPKSGHPIDPASVVGLEQDQQSQWLPVDEQLRLTVGNLTEEDVDLRERAFSALPQWPVGSPEELFGWRDSAVGEVMDLLGSHEYDQWSALARVSTALADIRTRDGVLRRILEQDHQRELVLVNLARMFVLARASHRAAIATVFAGAVWLGGDQALTRYAIDVALEVDSEYSLARLLDTALVHGVPHRVWVDSLAAVGYDKCLAGAA